MCCKKNEKTDVGKRTRIEVYQILGKDSRSSIEREASKKRYVLRGETQNFKHLPDQRMCGHWKAAQKREKQEWANEKPQLDNARRLKGICFIDPKKKKRKRKEKVGSSNGGGNALHERNKEALQLAGN